MSGKLRLPSERRARNRANFADLFDFQLRASKAAPFERELVFARPRRWRFDFAWPEYLVAVEIEGLVIIHGQLGQGRHHTVSGFKGDMDKYNAAAELGWRLLRFDQGRVKNGSALARTLAMLERWKPIGEDGVRIGSRLPPDPRVDELPF